MKRKSIGASTRWSIFARDNFTCRYCGSQAGQEGVTLQVDHVLSVVEGGDNRMENLVTACQRCNGGKSGRSLTVTPNSVQAIRNMRKSAKLTRALAQSIREEVEAAEEMNAMIIRMKCKAYDEETVEFAPNEIACARNLMYEFGAMKVCEWYYSASSNGVPEYRAVKYLCGCARRAREAVNG